MLALHGAPAQLALQVLRAAKGALERQLELEPTRQELQSGSAAQAAACEQHVP
jgi:hypothetical protein